MKTEFVVTDHEGNVSLLLHEHRREIAHRRARPISMRYGTSEYHADPQWLMLAFDIDKSVQSEFATVEACLAIVRWPNIAARDWERIAAAIAALAATASPPADWQQDKAETTGADQ